MKLVTSPKANDVYCSLTKSMPHTYKLLSSKTIDDDVILFALTWASRSNAYEVLNVFNFYECDQKPTIKEIYNAIVADFH